jgi:hypothetical protein
MRLLKISAHCIEHLLVESSQLVKRLSRGKAKRMSYKTERYCRELYLLCCFSVVDIDKS